MQSHRHRCEVRYALTLRQESRSRALEYINLVAARRGKEAAQKLQDDCSKQWAKGNNGEWGKWK